MRILLLLLVVVGRSPTLGKGRGGLVVGGKEASPDQFPFLALLKDGEADLCLANIVSPKWLITVASCAKRLKLNTIARVGSISKVENATEYEVRTWIIHEDFNYTSFKNDIALILVKGPIIFDELIQPVKLDYPQVDQNVSIAGWGYTQDIEKPRPNNLHYVNLNVISKKECEGARRFRLQLEHCCASQTKHRGPCTGDDGGPLLSPEGRLLALLSYAPQPCATAVPNIYTIPAYYLCWIVNKTNIPALYFLNY